MCLTLPRVLFEPGLSTQWLPKLANILGWPCFTADAKARVSVLLAQRICGEGMERSATQSPRVWYPATRLA